MRFARLCVFVLFALQAIVSSAALAQERVLYRFEPIDAVHHLARIEVTFPASQSQQLDIKLPTWRTGKYRILNLANAVRSFSAQSADGQSLNWQKVEKNTWRVDVIKGQASRVSYQLYANRLGDRASHLDETHAFLDASAVFMYTPEFRRYPLEVSLTVPATWQSFSGMPSVAPHRFAAPNYDVLVDSPIEAGLLSHRQFDVDGRQYEVTIWGEPNLDHQQLLDDLQKLSVTAGKIWGTHPYSRYVYMVHATDGVRGATEHLNSTVIQVQWDKFRERKDYIRFISTAAHELIHTWNVKAYRPAGMVPYDYQRENYSRLLWIAEGSTSYYDLLLPLRAGVTSESEFLRLFAREIDGYLNKPGRHQMPVAQASFDWWIEGGGDRARNQSVSIYGEGALTSWLMDFHLRANSDNSWDDLHRELYRRFPATERGYSVADVQQIMTELSGTDIRPLWASHVDGTESIDVERLLALVGLELRWENDQADADAGWKLKSNEEGILLDQVPTDSPAWRAGLGAGDRVIAINDRRVDSSNLAHRLKDFSPGEKVKVHYFRRDRLATAELALGESRGGRTLVKSDNATAAQKAAYQAWTGQPFDSNRK